MTYHNIAVLVDRSRGYLAQVRRRRRHRLLGRRQFCCRHRCGRYRGRRRNRHPPTFLGLPFAIPKQLARFEGSGILVQFWPLGYSNF